MIAKTIFPLILTIMLGLAITAVYADTQTFRGIAIANTDGVGCPQIPSKAEGTWQFNCTSAPNYPYKGTISLFDARGKEHILKSGDNVKFNLKTRPLRPGKLIINLRGSKDLKTEAMRDETGVFICTYEQIK